MFKYISFFSLLVLSFLPQHLTAQLSFCPGNTGDPIFEETFGQGNTNGPALAADVTSYTFVNQAPQDGEYTISQNLNQLDTWHNTGDHTADTNGKALIVNASFDPGLFYQIPIQGLCENNSYEFSAYLMNVYNSNSGACDGSGIPVNVKFQIWDETNTSILAEGNTSDINGTSTPNWQQFALTFSTLDNQNAVILKMLNNGEGGCGNDLAIDDIVFRSCGDATDVSSQTNDEMITLCGNDTLNDPITITAEPDFSVYDTHFYQWQYSPDNLNWTDISGETNQQLIINTFQEGFYRTLVAEDPVNVNNTLCNSLSNVFELNQENAVPAVSLGDQEICEGEMATLAVQEDSSIRINWYDQEIGGNLLIADSFTYETNNAGTYYAESITINGNCIAERTPVELTVNELPDVEDQEITRCQGEEVNLSTNDEAAQYIWNNGATSPEITVDQDGVYSVEISTEQGCSLTQNFTVNSIESPVIEEIISSDHDIKIITASSGDYSYSIDGVNFTPSPIIDNVEGGLYTISVLENNGCGIATQSFLHLIIPDLFSPNGDGINDRFIINDIEASESFSFKIFDRYGKLIFSATNQSFAWDGTFQGKKLPSSDYWYKLKVNRKIFTGNITLKR